MHKLQKERHEIRLSSEMENPFFSYGSLVYETSSYPMSLICCFRYGISSGASLMTTVSPFFAEEFTFFGEQLLRTTSFIWDSHMPHIIPSIFKTVLIIQYLLSSGNTAKRKRAGLYSWSLMKNLKSHTLSGYLKYSADEKKCQ